VLVPPFGSIYLNLLLLRPKALRWGRIALREVLFQPSNFTRFIGSDLSRRLKRCYKISPSRTCELLALIVRTRVDNDSLGLLRSQASYAYRKHFIILVHFPYVLRPVEQSSHLHISVISCVRSASGADYISSGVCIHVCDVNGHSVSHDR